MFLLNREDGTPIHGVEERPMAKGDVPGEWYPAKQPIPQSLVRSPESASRATISSRPKIRTPAHAAACRDLWDKRAIPQRRSVHAVELPAQRRPADHHLSGHDRRRELGWHGNRPEARIYLRQLERRATTGWIAPNPRYNEKTKDTEFPYVQQNGGALCAKPLTRTDDRSARCRVSVRLGPA